MYFTSNNASVKAIYLQVKSSYHVDNSMLCTTGKNQYYISETWIILNFLPFWWYCKIWTKRKWSAKVWKPNAGQQHYWGENEWGHMRGNGWVPVFSCNSPLFVNEKLYERQLFDIIDLTWWHNWQHFIISVHTWT